MQYAGALSCSGLQVEETRASSGRLSRSESRVHRSPSPTKGDLHY